MSINLTMCSNCWLSPQFSFLFLEPCLHRKNNQGTVLLLKLWRHKNVYVRTIFHCKILYIGSITTITKLRAIHFPSAWRCSWLSQIKKAKNKAKTKHTWSIEKDTTPWSLIWNVLAHFQSEIRGFFYFIERLLETIVFFPLFLVTLIHFHSSQNKEVGTLQQRTCEDHVML